MKHKLALAIAAAIALLLGLSAANAQEQEQEIGVSGERDFRMYCASCHGENAQGNGPTAEVLTIAPPDLTGLTKGSDGTFPAERIEKLIDGREEMAAHGSREMPVWGEWFKMEAAEGLGGAEGPETEVKRRITNVIDYLQSIQE
jgi:mono/diheme cytochrome c family protein